MHDYEEILEMNNQDFMSSFTGLISLISFKAIPSTSQTDLEFISEAKIIYPNWLCYWSE